MRLTNKEELRKANLVVNTLFEHKGAENGILEKELTSILAKNGFKMGNLRNLITRIKFERKIPICYTRKNGYFVAIRKSEILATVNDLRLMIASLEEHAQFLESFIVE